MKRRKRDLAFWPKIKLIFLYIRNAIVSSVVWNINMGAKIMAILGGRVCLATLLLNFLELWLLSIAAGKTIFPDICGLYAAQNSRCVMFEQRTIIQSLISKMCQQANPKNVGMENVFCIMKGATLWTCINTSLGVPLYIYWQISFEIKDIWLLSYTSIFGTVAFSFLSLSPLLSFHT